MRSVGPEFTTLRTEFAALPSKEIRDSPERVLVTFGGTDPARLTARVVAALDKKIDCEIRVVLGLGADHDQLPNSVTVLSDFESMAAEMHETDLIVTSAGRTVYEAAAAATPVVVLAQNAREATHGHLSLDDGVVFLGVGPLVDDDHVVEVVQRLLDDSGLRRELSERLGNLVDGKGARRIADRITSMIGGLTS
jgi:spore coat polysaccharide biosynthesis predicted glycosyltransferase SpsG